MTEQAKTEYILDTDIVPDDIQHVLIYWRDQFRKGAFEIGDIANSIIVRCASLGFPVTEQRVFDAVGNFCDREGRTVRYYAETAAFFPEHVRAEYDMLKFSHFVFARQVRDKWQDVLEYSALNPGVSVNMLRYKFLGLDAVCAADKATDSDVQLALGYGVAVFGGAEQSDQDPACAPDFVFATARTLSSVAVAISQLATLILEIKINDQARRELSEALAVVKKWLPEIINVARKGRA